MKKLVSVFILSILIIGCKNKPIENPKIVKNAFEIFDASVPDDVIKYKSYNLDDTCPNLLDPRISKDEINEVNNAWIDLNKNLGNYLIKQDFTWGMKIKVWHKFYFDKDGKLNKYFFNLLEDNIEKEKREQYKTLVKEFAVNYKLPITKDSPFAQCGKGAFYN